GEGHLFHHRKARRLVSGDFAKLGSLFQSFPKARLVLNALKKIPWHDRYPTLIADHLLELFKGVKREDLLEYLTSFQYSLKRKDACMATNLIARYYSKKDMDFI
uniref:hypothetical protein n=2 Tax=Pseudomonas syringae TaxID=317 RepID=UPI001FFA0551